MHDNPLLASGHPRFSAIRPEHVLPAVEQRIAEAKRLTDELLAKHAVPTWANLVAPLDAAQERIEDAFGPVSHLVHVIHDDAMRDAHKKAVHLVTDAETERTQNSRLFEAFQKLGAAGAHLTQPQRKVIADELREFRLAGAHLPPEAKARAGAIRAELSQLSVEFSQNVTDSTDAYRLVVDDPHDVAGLPDTLVAAARAQALRDDPSAPVHRWSFTLHAPSLMPFLTYQRNRALRESIFRANVTRATQGPHDNTPLIERTLRLRLELAKLLGFANFAEMALQRRMAKTPAEVHEFLVDLAGKARPHAMRERDELVRFARERDGIASFQRWDLPYYRELLRRERYDFSDEEVRRYLPIDRVLDGLSATVKRLYGATITDRTGASGFETWHEDVRILELANETGAVLGHVYTDFYARRGKQSGAWVGGMKGRHRRADGSLQAAAAYLVCNFTPPAGGKASLLRHDEARTLFHEFGHALHHVFSTVEERQSSGTRGVPRDGVELPSQFFENWIWHEEPLALMSGEVATGTPLPKPLLDKMLAARNYMKAADIIRQMEFALADLELHMATEPLGGAAIHAVFKSVRERVGVFASVSGDRFENSFQHIFAGGYAAGYYGYAWAEVLAADAFSRFEEEGIWSSAAARDFRDHILAKGSSADMMDLYVAFRGRKPTTDALFASAGLT